MKKNKEFRITQDVIDDCLEESLEKVYVSKKTM
jgi:hypothetical protein